MRAAAVAEHHTADFYSRNTENRAEVGTGTGTSRQWKFFVPRARLFVLDPAPELRIIGTQGRRWRLAAWSRSVRSLSLRILARH